MQNSPACLENQHQSDDPHPAIIPTLHSHSASVHVLPPRIFCLRARIFVRRPYRKRLIAPRYDSWRLPQRLSEPLLARGQLEAGNLPLRAFGTISFLYPKRVKFTSRPRGRQPRKMGEFSPENFAKRKRGHGSHRLQQRNAVHEKAHTRLTACSFRAGMLRCQPRTVLRIDRRKVMVFWEDLDYWGGTARNR
jgi:hypothetical protein